MAVSLFWACEEKFYLFSVWHHTVEKLEFQLVWSFSLWQKCPQMWIRLQAAIHIARPKLFLTNSTSPLSRSETITTELMAWLVDFPHLISLTDAQCLQMLWIPNVHLTSFWFLFWNVWVAKGFIKKNLSDADVDPDFCPARYSTSAFAKAPRKNVQTSQASLLIRYSLSPCFLALCFGALQFKTHPSPFILVKNHHCHLLLTEVAIPAPMTACPTLAL